MQGPFFMPDTSTVVGASLLVKNPQTTRSFRIGALSFMIVPTLCAGMPLETLCVSSVSASEAERHWLHSHAEHGNDHDQGPCDARPFFFPEI